MREDNKFALLVVAHVVRSRNRLKPNFLFPERFSTKWVPAEQNIQAFTATDTLQWSVATPPEPCVGSALLDHLVFVSCPQTCDALLQQSKHHFFFI